LWNAAEVAEKRKDSRVAREYEVALPHELTKAQRLELTREFSQEIANRFGCAVDFAIHKPHRSGDERNFHAHILTTTREVGTSGLGAKTDIELKDSDRAKKGLGPAKQEVSAIRERWAQISNEYLSLAGSNERVDHRSLEVQGIDREPTIHLGPAVNGMQRRGMDTAVGQRVKLEAQARLNRAAELGKLAVEAREIEASIISLSTDIRAALLERDRPATAKPGLAEARGKSREAWLELRKGAGRAPGQGAERERGRGQGSDATDTGTKEEQQRNRSPAKDDDFSL
jgi:ATP-dependent exoDNAse (exonuclease V) alpha subunit